MSTAPRRQLEAEWQERVAQARQRYYAEMERFQAVTAEYNGSSGVPRADSYAAVKNARRRESAARNEYMRVLRIFTELVLHGKPPEE